jgi:antitoxin (DNA-binding transcriptional repressor) of toxin-antitoxin stability system
MADLYYNLYDAKTSLSKLLERAARGEEIVLGKGGRPMARLGPLRKKHGRRKPGREKIRIADDFDAPLPKAILDQFYK